jgi:hypothetical protein
MDTLEDDLNRMLLSEGIRHFPIVQGDSIHRDDVVGILTVADLATAYLQKKKKPNAAKEQSIDPEILLLSGNPVTRSSLKTLLGQLSCEVIAKGGAPLEDIKEASEAKMPIVLDIDSYVGGGDYQTIISTVIRHPLDVVFITKNYDLARTLKGALKNKNHHIMLKPLDMSYLTFLSKQKSTGK